jgi:hypothetical protein
MATTKKKNSKPTGAKKVIRDASGPGLVRCGSSMPMGALAIRLEKLHSPFQPPASGECVLGDSVPAGKFTSSKSVLIASRKLFVRPVPAVSW